MIQPQSTHEQPQAALSSTRWKQRYSSRARLTFFRSQPLSNYYIGPSSDGRHRNNSSSSV